RLCFALVIRYIARRLLLDQRAWRRSWPRREARAAACRSYRRALLLIGLDPRHAFIDVAQRACALRQAGGHARDVVGNAEDDVAEIVVGWILWCPGLVAEEAILGKAEISFGARRLACVLSHCSPPFIVPEQIFVYGLAVHRQ